VNILVRYLPVLEWGRGYNGTVLTNDLVAAVIVTIMLIPQSLAYAMLAGLPPEMGLYASILPIIAYGALGTSRALAVGPVAVVSLMTLTAASSIAPPGSAEFIAAALVLALLSGLFLLAMGVLRLGFLANLLSHPVVSGFITASGIIIATSQLKSIFGIKASGAALPELVTSLTANIATTNMPTLVIGVAATAFLFWVRKGLKPLLMRFGLAARPADLLAKAGPIAAVAVSTVACIVFGLEDKGVKVVGQIPQSLPPLTLPMFDINLWQRLAVPAMLLSIIGFVESVSVAQTLAAKKRQRIAPDQELIGLGRSEERRVGKECRRLCRSRWSPYH
jgi:SulP family sulfate permease